MVHVPTNVLTHRQHLSEGTRLTGIEVGYRSDYDPTNKKYTEKMMQHSETCTSLRKTYDLDYQVWDIGYTGMIPLRTRQQAARLGVANVDKLLTDIHRIAIEHAYTIVQDRRNQERQVELTSSQHYRHFTPIPLRRTTAPPR